MDFYIWMRQYWSSCKTSIYHLCADTACNLEDLSGMMDDRDGIFGKSSWVLGRFSVVKETKILSSRQRLQLTYQHIILYWQQQLNLRKGHFEWYNS